MNAAFRNDRGNELVGGHVERGIAHVRALGGQLVAADVRHFAGIAFLGWLASLTSLELGRAR